MKRLICVCTVGIMCCVASAASSSNGQGQPPPGQGGQQRPPQGQGGQQKPPQGQGGQQKQKQKGKQNARSRSAGQMRPAASNLSSADQRLLEAIEEADSRAELSRLLQRTISSTSAEVRQAMVDALEEQGRGAVDELALFIGDVDAEVAEAAFSSWSSIVAEMRPAAREAAIQSAAQILQRYRPQQSHAMPQGGGYGDRQGGYGIQQGGAAPYRQQRTGYGR